jgi:exodeoxyribonuclease V beta subunit
MSDVLSLQSQSLDNGLFIEASAGTGKTYSVAALVVRELALNDDLSISQILVTTFTRNAAAELRDRVRRRLVKTAESLRKNSNEEDDVIVEYLLSNCSDAERIARSHRLMRAVVEFDTATIATIHSVCSKIISLSAESTSMAGEEVQTRLIAEVVNDALVAQAFTAPTLPEKKIIEVVTKLIGEPLTQTWFDPAAVSSVAFMQRIDGVVKQCVLTIEEELRKAPTFDYLIRRAFQVIGSDEVEGVLGEFRRRYKYLIVDEAQDTDSQQWEIFRGIFPMGENLGGALIAVGDPKQSIYKFRGADIDAYRVERNKGLTRTLRTNYRSSSPVIRGLNALFDGTEFGQGIPYVSVDVPKEKKDSELVGMAPVEILNVSDPSGPAGIAIPTARRVSAYLRSGVFVDGKAVHPSDVVVLVRSGWQGQLIERQLRELKIPAVSSGTASVMDSETAEHWRVLLLALERFADAGRVRHVVGTPIFGVSLSSPALLDDVFIGTIQETLAKWAAVLRHQGVAALTSTMMSDPGTIMSLSAGLSGERRLTDFSHVADLLNAETNGEGCSATDVLDAFTRLVEIDSSSELVSRRVESDSSAVQIMTIHVSKGLEFPLVIVADSWKEDLSANQKKKLPIIRLQKDDAQSVLGRVVDIGYVTGEVSPISLQRLQEEASEESSRILYVAATRAKHHVCIVRPLDGKVSVIDNRMNASALAGDSESVTVLNVNELPNSSHYVALKKDESDEEEELLVAESPSAVKQTYRRTSFTGITEIQKGGSVVGAARADTRSGTEEGERLFIRSVGYASARAPLGVAEMPLARIPGGAHIGKILHTVYEHVDPSHADLPAHVASVVGRHVSGKLFTDHGQDIIDGIVLSLRTPLGGAIGQHSLVSLGLKNRVAEMSFEMSLAHLSSGVKASDIGRLLKTSIPEDDLLAAYAQTLCDSSFDIPLAGLINGSIDALLRVELEAGVPRFFISDYKSNRLDRDGDELMIQAYSTERMLHEMEHHHYPLQALIYGAAVYRFLRWRAPQIDADAAIAGFAYMFIRGMVGEATPADANGHRTGVLTWTAPKGFWSTLSDLFAGGLT